MCNFKEKNIEEVRLFIKNDAMLQIDEKWGRYLQGWMMENIEPNIAEILHEKHIRPYSLSVIKEKILIYSNLIF